MLYWAHYEKDESTGEDVLSSIVKHLEEANDPNTMQQQGLSNHDCVVTDSDPDTKKKDKQPKEKSPKIGDS